MKRSGPLPHSTVRLAVLLAVIALALILVSATAVLAQEPPPNPSPPAAPRAAANPGGACSANPSPPAALTPAIRVTAPAAFAVSGSPLRIEGIARVFEGTVRYTVRDAAGAVLADGFTTAATGAPEFGPFAATLRFSVVRETAVCLQVFEESAEDGRPVNIVQVPITLRPFDPALDRGAATGAGLLAAAGLSGPAQLAAVVGDWALVRGVDTTTLLRRDGQGRWAAIAAGSGVCAVPDVPPLLCALPPALADTSGLPAATGRPAQVGALRFLVPEAATTESGAQANDLTVEQRQGEPDGPPAYAFRVSEIRAAYGPLDAWVYDRVMDGARRGCPLLLSRLELNGAEIIQAICTGPTGRPLQQLWLAPAGVPGPVALVSRIVDFPGLDPWQPLADQAVALLLASLRVEVAAP